MRTKPKRKKARVIVMRGCLIPVGHLDKDAVDELRELEREQACQDWNANRVD